MKKVNPVIYIALSGFIITTSIQVINPILSIYLVKNFDASLSEVGVIFSVFSLSSFLFRVLLVFLIPSISLSYLLLAGIVINSAAILGYLLVSDIETLIIFRIIHGFAFSLDNTAMLTLAGLSTSRDQEMTTTVAKYAAALALGLMVGPAVATLSVTFYGVSATLLVAFLTSIPAVLFTILFIRATKGIWIGHVTRRISWVDFRRLISRLGLQIASITLFLFSFSYSVLIAYAPLVAGLKYNLPDNVITALFFGYFLVTFSLRMALPRLMESVSMSKLLSMSLLLASSALVFMGISTTPFLFAVGFEIMGIGHGFIFPLTAALVARAIPPHRRINGNAIYLASWDVGALAGPLAAAFLSLYLEPQLILLTMTPATLIALLLVKQIPKTGIE